MNAKTTHKQKQNKKQKPIKLITPGELIMAQMWELHFGAELPITALHMLITENGTSR